MFKEEDENFMTLENVTKVMKELVVKNCKGYDRLPLRIFNKGAEVLSEAMMGLFSRIYN